MPPHGYNERKEEEVVNFLALYRPKTESRMNFQLPIAMYHRDALLFAANTLKGWVVLCAHNNFQLHDENCMGK